MVIIIHSIRQEGRRGDLEVYNPNSRDIYHAQNIIDLYLLKCGYIKGIETLKVKPQGFGHGSPYVHMPYSNQGILIDSVVDFIPGNDSARLRVIFAISPLRLESLVLDIIKNSNLPKTGWVRKDSGEFEISPNIMNKFGSVEELVKYLNKRQAKSYGVKPRS